MKLALDVIHNQMVIDAPERSPLTSFGPAGKIFEVLQIILAANHWFAAEIVLH